MSNTDLENRFNDAMLDIYKLAKSEAGYNATIFLRMLHDRGGLLTAKYLINSVNQSDGYTALYMEGRLDLTVEAMVVEQSEWHPLFSLEEIERAKKRLKQYDYVVQELFAPRTDGVK